MKYQHQSCLLSVITLFFAVVFISSCNKDTPAPAVLDHTLLTRHNWLITPRADSFYCKDIDDSGNPGGPRHRMQVIVIDTTRLVYLADSTEHFTYFPTVIFNRDTALYTGPFLADYMPVVGSTHSGTYSVNWNDSTITTTVTSYGVTLPPITHKILMLTNDSLKLWHSMEGISAFHAE